MVFDYNALSTWKTPDLLTRDSRLVNRTRVMGMSEKAAIIHIVALVCTVGFSLPVNLGFCIWHAHRYGEIKKERMSIRQILGKRNMSYRGKGHWVEAKPTPNRGQKVQVQPTPNRGQKMQVQPTPNRGQKVKVQRTPNRGQNVQVTRTPPANNDPQMQYAQANANASVNNDLQMETSAYASVDDFEQGFGNNAVHDLQMQYVEVNAYASVDDYEQDFENNADSDLQMQFEQDIGDSAVNELELDIGSNDALSEAIVPGLLEILAS